QPRGYDASGPHHRPLHDLRIPRTEPMPYDFTIEPDNHLVRVRYSGLVTVEERRAAVQQVIGEAVGPGIHRVLLDYRGANAAPADEAAAEAVADAAAALMLARGMRVAWLVNYDHQLRSEERRVGNA